MLFVGRGPKVDLLSRVAQSGVSGAKKVAAAVMALPGKGIEWLQPRVEIGAYPLYGGDGYATRTVNMPLLEIVLEANYMGRVVDMRDEGDQKVIADISDVVKGVLQTEERSDNAARKFLPLRIQQDPENPAPHQINPNICNSVLYLFGKGSPIRIRLMPGESVAEAIRGHMERLSKIWIEIQKRQEEHYSNERYGQKGVAEILIRNSRTAEELQEWDRAIDEFRKREFWEKETGLEISEGKIGSRDCDTNEYVLDMENTASLLWSVYSFEAFEVLKKIMVDLLNRYGIDGFQNHLESLEWISPRCDSEGRKVSAEAVSAAEYQFLSDILQCRWEATDNEGEYAITYWRWFRRSLEDRSDSRINMANDMAMPDMSAWGRVQNRNILTLLAVIMNKGLNREQTQAWYNRAKSLVENRETMSWDEIDIVKNVFLEANSLDELDQLLQPAG